MTELFISDIHGEYEAFSHIVRSGCGLVPERIDELFGSRLDGAQRAQLAALVEYPAEKAGRLTEEAQDGQMPLHRLAGLVAELLASYGCEAPAASGAAAGDLAGMCEAVQRAAVDKVHVVGDVYDRGPAAELVMDELVADERVDIQWGNHDIVWMGAALGQWGCIAHVVRNCARYGNLRMLADAYGMDVSALETFACSAYADDPCTAFGLKGDPGLSAEELELNVKVQKAMAILQFKVEAQLIDENPSFGLEDRKLLHRIDRTRWTVEVDGTEYDVADTVFPTVDWDAPYALTEGERRVMESLEREFTCCDRLQRHVRLFLEKGSLYKVCGNVLAFHACVPLNADGTLKEVEVYGDIYKGKSLFDAVDGYVRDAYTAEDPVKRKRGLDLLWYLWLGEGSPLFAKSKMATFEIYLIADKAARKEVKNPFYSLLEDAQVLDSIFADFNMDPAVSRIVCGHVPVKVKDGEDPVKCGGKAVIIDGGMSAAYQKTTGVAGFTLMLHDGKTTLFTHEPYAGRRATLESGVQMSSSKREV